MSLLHLYRTPGFSAARREALLAAARERISPGIQAIETEYCFNIDAAGELTPDEFRTLSWLLSETFEPTRFGRLSFLQAEGELLEVGPRMNFTTAWSTNAVSVCHACGLK
nr:hypothetical protein [Gemmatimonadota bacterium]